MSQDQADERYKAILKRIRDFRLFDDSFMTKCFEDSIECTELLLRIIMNKPDLKVKKVHTQYMIKNLQGRSLTLDVNATDSEKREYDIEIQRADSGARPKRARYHSSLIDANALLAGDTTENLPETYIIFITENDVIGKNKPIYHINRYIEETGEKFDDDAHIIYVNGKYQDDTPLGLLMKDFSCTNPSDMHYKILADRAKYFKEDAKGVSIMCKIVEDLVEEFIDDDKRESALRLLKIGKLSNEEIAEGLALDIEVVNAIDENQKAMIY